jgi:hypothetical protein
VAVGVAEFPGPWLGMAFPGAIWIDQDAAGYGWFVDPTPGDNAEFRAVVSGRDFVALPGSAAAGRIDLLTVVVHELGHELGLDDNLDPLDVMDEALAPGVRRLPAAADVAHTGLPQGSGASGLSQPQAVPAPPAPAKHALAGEPVSALSAADLGLFFEATTEDTWVSLFGDHRSNRHA